LVFNSCINLTDVLRKYTLDFSNKKPHPLG
jgi:hypothetical protein